MPESWCSGVLEAQRQKGSSEQTGNAENGFGDHFFKVNILHLYDT